MDLYGGTRPRVFCYHPLLHREAGNHFYIFVFNYIHRFAAYKILKHNGTNLILEQILSEVQYLMKNFIKINFCEKLNDTCKLSMGILIKRAPSQRKGC